MKPKYYRWNEGVTDGPFTLGKVQKLLKAGGGNPLFAKEGSDEWLSTAAILDQIRIHKSRKLWGSVLVAIASLLLASILALILVTRSNQSLKSEVIELKENASNKSNKLVEEANRGSAQIVEIQEKLKISQAENTQLKQDLIRVRSELDQSKEKLNDLVFKSEKAKQAAIFSSGIASGLILTLGKQASKPKTIIIHSSVTEGQLSFNSSWINGILAPIFKNNGLQVATRSNSEDAWVVSVRIQQIDISRGVNSAYSVNVGLFSPGQVGYSRKAVMVEETFTIGHAGTSSDYLSETRKFLEDSAAIINGAIEEASADAVDYETLNKVFDHLEKAGISTEPDNQQFDRAINRASGSGFLIDGSKLVLTNYHVVESGSKIRVEVDPDGAGIPASVGFFDASKDLALLTLENPISREGRGFTPCFARAGDLKLGTRVYGFGFPLSSILGSDIKYTEGVVSGEPVEGVFQISAPVQPGNSGGALFTDDNRICGIVSATLNPFHVLDRVDALPQNVNYGISPDVIRDFLIRSKIPVSFADSPPPGFDRDAARSLSVRIIVE